MGDGITDLTRDDARKHWAASGLTFAVLTKGNVDRLRDLCDAMAAVCPECAQGHPVVLRNRPAMRWSHDIPGQPNMIVCKASDVRGFPPYEPINS